jgi:hypothetical protein
MRLIFSPGAVALVVGLAYWAYDESLQTRDARAEVRQLNRDIRGLKSSLVLQRAEWAYLNRPERLRDLADLNFGVLGLMPMTGDDLGRVAEVPFPVPPDPDSSEGEAEGPGLPVARADPLRLDGVRDTAAPQDPISDEDW